VKDIFNKRLFLLKHEDWEHEVTILHIFAAIISAFMIAGIVLAVWTWGFIPLVWLFWLWAKKLAQKFTFKFVLLQLGKRGVLDIVVMPQRKQHVLSKIMGPIKKRGKYIWKSIGLTFKVFTGVFAAVFGGAYIVFASGAKTLMALATFILKKLGIAKLFSGILAFLIKLKAFPILGMPFRLIIDVVIFQWILSSIVKYTPRSIKNFIYPLYKELRKVLDDAIEAIDRAFGTKLGDFGDWLSNFIWNKTHDEVEEDERKKEKENPK
jgi:hypothetical protein